MAISLGSGQGAGLAAPDRITVKTAGTVTVSLLRFSDTGYAEWIAYPGGPGFDVSSTEAAISPGISNPDSWSCRNTP